MSLAAAAFKMTEKYEGERYNLGYKTCPIERNDCPLSQPDDILVGAPCHSCSYYWQGMSVYREAMGLDDVSDLGKLRIEKTEKIFKRSDIIILLIEANSWTEYEDYVKQDQYLWLNQAELFAD